MPITVKICGLRTPETLEAAIAARADYAGLVFFGPSPRNVTLTEAARLVKAARGRIQTVALMVDPSNAGVADVIASVGPDCLQLHGDETPDRTAEIRARAGRPVIKAIKVADAADVARAAAYAAAADLILYDARAPSGADRPGGNGVAFDWSLLAEVRTGPPFMLSGGLDPDNVRAAIARSGARSVDVSSGVESAPGIKDPDRIHAFVTAARAYATRPRAVATPENTA